MCKVLHPAGATERAALAEPERVTGLAVSHQAVRKTSKRYYARGFGYRGFARKERMRNLHQALTYWFGYRRGKRGIALKCPWWANCLVYAVAHMYGYNAYLEAASKAVQLGS